MKDFLNQEAVLVREEPRLQELALDKLKWSRSQWWDRMRGRVSLKPAERIALKQCLEQVRNEMETEALNACAKK